MTDWSPIFISMKTASVSIFITFFLGLIVAWGLFKMKNDTGKIVLDGIFTLPLVLPPTVVGFFLLWIFGVRGPIGSFFIDFFAYKIAFSWPATVIAAVVMSFPLMYRSARGAFEQIDSNLLDAGRTLGMSEWKIFWKIVLPLCKGAITSVALLVFIDYWNMVEQPLIMLSNSTYHPLSVFLSKINQGEIGLAFAVATIYMVPPILLFLYGEDYLVDGIAYSGSVRG